MRCLTVFPRLLLVATLLAWLLTLPAGVSAAPKAGQAAPEFNVTTLAGQSVSLENYRGKVLAVDFFATWCKPCQASIPHLNELSRNYGKQGFHVLGMSADEDGEKGVKIFAERLGITYPVAMAGEAVLAAFGVRSVPVLIVLDRKGKVAEVFRGYGPEVGRASEQLIKKLLAEK